MSKIVYAVLFTQIQFIKMTKYGFLYLSSRSLLCLSHGSQGLGTDETKIENFLRVTFTLTISKLQTEMVAKRSSLA